MKKAINYKPNINSVDGFIIYKLCIMPESVLGEKYRNCSYKYLMMNNELIKLLEIKLFSKEMCDNISLDMLSYLKSIISESVNFYNFFSERAQTFSKKFKSKKIKHGSISLKFKKPNEDLYFAKYICYKEAYDLELPLDKIKNFDIEKAQKILNMLHSIILPKFNSKQVKYLKYDIIQLLKDDINFNINSTTLETININNIYFFKALICQQEVLDCIKILFYQNKMSDYSLDLCIKILNYSIDASNGILNLKLYYLIDKSDINSFDKESAIKLRNDMICEKYRRIEYEQKEYNLK